MHRRPFRLQLKIEHRGHKNDENDNFKNFSFEAIFEAAVPQGSLKIVPGIIK